MKITKEYTQSIVNILPIGYYLKHNLNVIVDDTSDCSYIILQNEEIHISLKQLNNALENKQNLSKDEIEDNVRCLLYHEVSHALLTPKQFPTDDIYNIFEDERIETILANFYKNVNFKQFLFNLTKFNYEAPKSALQMFYQVVRFRFGPKYFVNMVKHIIEKYSFISSTNTSHLFEYKKDIELLYTYISNYFTSKTLSTKQSEQSTSNKDNTNDTSNKDNTNDTSNDNTNDNTNEVENSTITIDTSTFVKEAENIDEQFTKEVLSKFEANIEDTLNSLTKYVNTSIDETIQTIFLSYKNATKNNGSAINSYSGKFDCRSVIRDDYKYFVQSNRQGNLKRYSKINLNLIIDRSGSFSYSQVLVNQLLRSLTKLEKRNSNFSFNLMTCGMTEKIHDKNERYIICNGCNNLTDELQHKMSLLQNKHSTNINIVLFDGDAFSGSNDRWNKFRHNEELQKFAAFNLKNAVIISNDSNQYAINKYCPLAKRIFTYNYTDELLDNVYAALRQLLR